MTTGKPADPARIYQAYVADCERNGKRGAYARLAKIYGRSPERIRQIVVEHKPQPIADDAPPPYEPPPFAYPEPQARSPEELLLAQLVMQPVTCEITSSPNVEPISLPSAACEEPQALELPRAASGQPFVALIPHDFAAAAHNVADAALLVMAGLFVLELAAAARHAVLALLLLVPLLLWCHVAAVMGRDWRRLKGSGEG